MSIACLNGCGRVATERGCCRSCVTVQRKAIRNGLTTDAELVAQGKRAPRIGKAESWRRRIDREANP